MAQAMSPSKDVPGISGAVDIHREIRRQNIAAKQQRKRYQLLGKRRQDMESAEINTKVYTPKEVEGLAISLKQKKSQNITVLKQLKHAVAQDTQNISAFFAVDGALYSLIGLLTGLNGEYQLEAASIVANLALSDNEKLCLRLAKASTSYLVVYLTSTSMLLKDTCAWALGNMAGSYVKVCSILRKNNVMKSLVALLSSPSEYVVQSALYALYNFIKTDERRCQAEELLDVTKSTLPLLKSNPPVELYWLLYLLSHNPSCEELFLVYNAMAHFAESIINRGSSSEYYDILCLTPVVRCLGNLSAGIPTTVAAILKLDVVSVVLKLLQHPLLHIQKEGLWLVANLVNCDNSEVQEYLKEVEFRLAVQSAVEKAVQCVEPFHSTSVETV